MLGQLGQQGFVEAVSYSVPFSTATRDSVAGWLVPPPKGDRAVSTTSTPASMALRMVMEPVPAVLWVCSTMGSFVFAFSFFTRE